MFRSFKLVFAAFVPLVFSATALAQSDQDFIEFAGTHCRAFIADGRADMEFVLGKAASVFSPDEMLEFNRQFAAKIIREYHIDPTKSCVMDVLSMKPLVTTNNKPAEKGRYAQPKAQREVAVVAGVMGAKNTDVPISVAYRFERMGTSPWVITNITLNGQPLVDRYREEYEALVAKGGIEAVLN